MTIQHKRTFCRVCEPSCGMIATVEDGRLTALQPDREHPVTKGMANFHSHDEIYYSLNMLPEARILASSFHDVFNIAPQIWSYEKDNYRAIVSIPGHNHTTFSLPHYRTLLLRAIAMKFDEYLINDQQGKSYSKVI